MFWDSADNEFSTLCDFYLSLIHTDACLCLFLLLEQRKHLQSFEFQRSQNKPSTPPISAEKCTNSDTSYSSKSKKKWGGLGRGKMLSVMFFLLLNSSSASKLQQISKAREAGGQTELQRWDINYFHKTVFLRVTLQWQKKWHNGTEDFKTQTSQGQVFGPKASLPFLDRCGASYWSDCTPRAQRTVLYLKTCILKWLYPINSYLSCFADELNDHMQVLYLYRFYSRLRTLMKRAWITQHCLNLISLKAFQAVILIDL